MARISCQILVLIVGLISGTQSANILGIFTSFGPSHLIVELSLAKVLAENGHNVTVVTALKPPVNHKNFNVIQVPLSSEDERKLSDVVASMASRDNSNIISSLIHMLDRMKLMCDTMFKVVNDSRVTDLYENEQNKFDLVILGFFMNNYQVGIAHKLKVPVVMAAPMPPLEFLGTILGNPPERSYVPSTNIAVEMGQTMNFVQRLMNLITSFAFNIFNKILEHYNAQYYEQLYGNDPDMPRYKDLTKNVSLIFTNSHAPSEGPIRPNVPGIIEVGGIQAKEQPDPLPQNIADFLDNATNGAILLSLGSNVKGAHLKPDTVQKMFNVLSKLKQRVVWKWEDLDKTPGQSSNILYSKWLPQDDILAHPNIKLFITHAGRGGITEAQYHGKPMLALPVFGDQPGNAEKMVKDGFGLSLRLLELEEKPFHESILQVLEQPQYLENVKRFSTLYRDRPLTARQSVLYWIEYVLRHHGAPHLQSPVVHMSFIAANNLDVYALLLALLLVFLLVSKFTLTLIYRKLSGKGKSKKLAKNKQKKH